MIPVGFTPRDVAIMGVALGFMGTKFEEDTDAEVLEMREALPDGVDREEVMLTALKLATVFTMMNQQMREAAKEEDDARKGRHESRDPDKTIADLSELPKDVLNRLRFLERQFSDE